MITVKWWVYAIAIAATLSAVGASYVLTYTKGYHAAESAYRAQISAIREDNLRKIIEQERKASADQDKIIGDYLAQIEELREENRNAMVEMDKLRDVVIYNPGADCVSGTDKSSTAGVPAKTAVKPGLKCYTDSELRRKIESSLAIAREADELALRYAALVKACSQ
jgi:hypothetical protein